MKISIPYLEFCKIFSIYLDELDYFYHNFYGKCKMTLVLTLSKHFINFLFCRLP